MISTQFLAAKPGTKGRRLTRHLNDKKVMLAQVATMNPEHQAKFKPRWKNEGAV